MTRVLIVALCLMGPTVRAVEVAPDVEILAKIRQRMKGQRDLIHRSVNRVGEKTLEFEAIISTEGDFNAAPDIFSDFKSLDSWALKGINDKPGGGTYFLIIRSVRPDHADPKVAHATFLFDLPLFKYEAVRAFRVTPEKKPDVFTMTIESLVEETSAIGKSEGFLKIYRADKDPHRLWIYAKGRAKIKNWLLYEALPEKLLLTETSERIPIFLQNYQGEESRRKSEDKKLTRGKNPPRAPLRDPEKGPQ